ncbi:MT-A70 protein [Trichuris suis]|nr:MT-A70 protein [Trichuris suis]
MAVMCYSEDGWLVDECHFYSKIYKDSRRTYNPNMYAINEPFLNESQFRALEKLEGTSGCKRRKRKRKSRPNSSFEIRAEFTNFVKQKSWPLTDIGMAYSCFPVPSCSTVKNNNREAKKVQATFLAILRKYSLEDRQTDSMLSDVSAVVQFHVNQTPNCTTSKWNGNDILLPPFSEFAVCDIRPAVSQLVNERRKYDLIIMDPPWDNRSPIECHFPKPVVESLLYSSSSSICLRKHFSYSTTKEPDLQELKIDTLLENNGLLVIWFTNNERVMRYACDNLLPSWHMQIIGIWHWLKVTRSGKPVHPYNIEYKLPFENLLIACAQNSEIGCKVPKKKVIVSVPCAIFSRKPPLNDILSSYLRYPCRTLELFARGLLPHTTSRPYPRIFLRYSFYSVERSDPIARL